MDVNEKDMIYFMVMCYVFCMLDICVFAQSPILHANLLAAACHAHACIMCVLQSALCLDLSLSPVGVYRMSN